MREEFERRGPWITGFDIAGERYGGDYHAASDWRLREFEKRVDVTGKTVLELGPLEGGFTVELCKRGGIVTAIEGRLINLERARWVADIYGVSPRFIHGNLETCELPIADVCFNVGVLYHLPEPWVLLAKARNACKLMFLWTHVAQESTRTWGGYHGIVHTEAEPGNPLSGLSIAAFWPTLDELMKMLADTGWSNVEVIEGRKTEGSELSETLLLVN